MAPGYPLVVTALDAGTYMFAGILQVIAALIVTVVMVIKFRSQFEGDF